MQFWLPALLIVGLCAAKDAMGTTLAPGLKKPLDVLETIENKLSALVAAGAVVPFVLEGFSKVVDDAKTVSASPAFGPDGLAMLSLGSTEFAWVVSALTILLGLAVFAVVWMASHALQVLILLSPWGAIDAALKAMRTGLLGLIALGAIVNPWLGAALSVVVISVAWLLAGWAYRLTVFGSIFCWDFATRRSGRFSPRENDNPMFAGPKLAGVPIRALGRLVMRSGGGLEFYYRPWPWLPERRAIVPERTALAVGRGFFFSTVLAGEETILLLPPRYRGHEAVLVRAYLMGGGIRDAGMRKAWTTLRELFGGAAAQTQII